MMQITVMGVINRNREQEAHGQATPSHPCLPAFLFFVTCVSLSLCIISPPAIQEEDDYDVMQDPEFLQSVLENLPGVDPNNEAIRNAMGSLASQASKENKDKKEEEKK